MRIPEKLSLVNVPSHALQTEGAEIIVKTLKKYDLDGVVIFPAYYTEVNEDGRWRLPPLLNSFEKTIFGKKSCRIERRSPFPHNKKYYRNTKVTPVKYKGHEDIWTPFIRQCKSADLKVFLAMVPLVSFDDVNEFVPRYYNGAPFEEYLGFLCPNNPDVMNFALDSVRELINRYDFLCDGLLLDHVEYPAYSLNEIFTCFCKHCQKKAKENGINVGKAITETEQLLHKLGYLFSEAKGNCLDNVSIGMTDGISLALSHPNLLQYFNFKLKTISNTHQAISSEIRKLTKNKPLGNGAFAPSYSMFTGLDYSRIEKYYDFSCPKLYSQHWSKMLNNTLKEANEINADSVQENIIKAFMKFVGTSDRSYINQELQVSSKLTEKEVLKAKYSSFKPFIPWLNCAGSAKELEIKLEILSKNNVKNAFFQEYMFLDEEKLNLIKFFINSSN